MFSEFKVLSIKTESTPPLKIQENDQNRGPVSERDLGSSTVQPWSPRFLEHWALPGAHPLPCTSKTGCRASWCRDRWPHSGCQDQTLFLSKAHRHYNGFKHSFTYSENRNQRFSYFRQVITWSKSTTLSINVRSKMCEHWEKSRDITERVGTPVTRRRSGAIWASTPHYSIWEHTTRKLLLHHLHTHICTLKPRRRRSRTQLRELHLKAEVG